MSKLKPYTTYQPVQYDYVSQLPDGWQLLPNIAIFRERIERGHENEELLSVTIGRGVIKQSELEKKDSSTLDKSKYLLLYPGDLVYSMRFRQGASGYSIYKGIVSPACTVLKPIRGIEINPRFFFYMFRTGFYKNYVERFAYGIADGQIPLRYVDFKRMYSIVPPLETQNAIVQYLDRKTQQIQQFIAKKERLIELLEEQKRNIIDSTYLSGTSITQDFIETNNVWIKEIPQNWSLKPLKYLTKIISKGTTPSTEGQGMAVEGIRFLKAENIYNSEVVDTPEFFIDEKTHKILSRSQLKENDILFVIAGATIGKVAILKSHNLPANTNQAVSFIRLKKQIDVEYCFYWLQSSFINTLIWLTAVQAAQPNLAMEDLGNIDIPFPDNDDEKLEITNRIKSEHSNLNSAISKAKTEIEKAKEYQESLITQVVTGQLKVPEKSNANFGKNIELGMVAEPNGAYRSTN
jgi:type I restriction enzyme S subunit